MIRQNKKTVIQVFTRKIYQVARVKEGADEARRTRNKRQDEGGGKGGVGGTGGRPGLWIVLSTARRDAEGSATVPSGSGGKHRTQFGSLDLLSTGALFPSRDPTTKTARRCRKHDKHDKHH